MIRLAGVTLPENKRVEIALTYIYGVGPSRSKVVLEKSGIDPNTKVKDITEQQALQLRTFLAEYILEGELRRQIQLDIKRLQDIGCYRGMRHKKSLPVRGQRTKTNSRTRKGKRKTIANKKKATK